MTNDVTDMEDFRVRRQGGCWLFVIERCQCGYESLAVAASVMPWPAQCAGCREFGAELTGVIARDFATCAEADAYAREFIRAARAGESTSACQDWSAAKVHCHDPNTPCAIPGVAPTLGLP